MESVVSGAEVAGRELTSWIEMKGRPEKGGLFYVARKLLEVKAEKELDLTSGVGIIYAGELCSESGIRS